MKIFTLKGTFITLVLVAALIYILPTFYSNVWPHKKINLGLDLQGGMHLVLEVQNEKAVETTLEKIIHELKIELRKKNIKHLGLSLDLNNNTIQARIKQDKNINSFNALLKDEFNNLIINSTAKNEDTQTFVLNLSDKEINNIKKWQLSRLLKLFVIE